MGWPPLDVQIYKFEMDQSLKACDIDLAAQRFQSKKIGIFELIRLDEEIERAERVIESVVFRRRKGVRDDIDEKRE